MSCTLVAFFASLIVLVWAKIRGITWKQIREDIGWTKGAGVTKEFFYGIAGYSMMLPILVVGVLITLLFMLLQGTAGEPDPFAGTGGGSHPIIVEIANGSWDLFASLYFYLLLLLRLSWRKQCSGVFFTDTYARLRVEQVL